jgi:geranylgeranyl pyrophosphate synthase
MHALRHASAGDRRSSLAILKRNTDRSVDKRKRDVLPLLELIRRHGSIAYARRVALRRATRARATLERLAGSLVPSVHLEFLRAVTDFVITRDH